MAKKQDDRKPFYIAHDAYVGMSLTSAAAHMKTDQTLVEKEPCSECGARRRAFLTQNYTESPPTPWEHLCDPCARLRPDFLSKAAALARGLRDAGSSRLYSGLSRP